MLLFYIYIDQERYIMYTYFVKYTYYNTKCKRKCSYLVTGGKMRRGIKYDFNLLALLIIPVGVALNFVGYQLSAALKLPIWLDQVGTWFVSLIAGPWVGIVMALLGNIVNGMLIPTAIPFALVAMVNALFIGIFSRFKFFNNIITVIIACIIINIATAVPSAFVTTFVFGGATGSGSDLITAAFLAAGKALLWSSIQANLVEGTFSVVFDFFIAWMLVRRLPDRFLVKLNYGLPYIKDKEALKYA